MEVFHDSPVGCEYAVAKVTERGLLSGCATEEPLVRVKASLSAMNPWERMMITRKSNVPQTVWRRSGCVQIHAKAASAEKVSVRCGRIGRQREPEVDFHFAATMRSLTPLVLNALANAQRYPHHIATHKKPARYQKP